jgi:beta-carotene ketolase (CrtO type)
MRAEREIKTAYPLERYDVVVIGGGPNGLGIAALLGKAGLKVCVLEERLQCGGGAENVEPIPGFRIDPHATYFYAGASPTIEILELWKFGFRLKYFKTLAGTVTSDGKAIISGRFNIKNTIESIAKYSKKDAEFTKIMYETFEPYTKDFLRSIFWTPPYTPEMWSDPYDLPWFKFMKERAPGLLTLFPPEVVMELSTYELLDTQYEFEPLKVVAGQGAWYNGPFPAWRGMGIFGIATGLLMAYSSSSPQGGMHSYMHALIRCCLHYGVKIYTNAKVGEILVENGEAKGVVLADESFYPGKVIRAERLVISAIDVKQTFLKLLKGKYIPKPLLEKIKDINLHGGSLFVLHLIVKDLPKYKGDAEELFFKDGNYPTVVCLPGDSRSFILNQAQDIFSFRTHPQREESLHIMVCCHDIYDETRCPPGYHVLSPIYIQVPPPEYHRDGPDAVNKAKWEIAERMIELLRKFAPNMTEKNIVAKFINTPQDSEFRNTGFIGGNWYAIRECEDQWWSFRPIPELARYRTPIHKLYLCHQTSYPGGLCLLAVPYNLMHILIDDGAIEKPDWFISSPYHIPDGEKRFY